MLNVLLESRARRARQRGGALVSIALHSGLILVAVATTGNGKPPTAPDPVEQTIPIYSPIPLDVSRTERRTGAASPARSAVRPPPPIVVPRFIPVGVPPLPVHHGAIVPYEWRAGSSLGSSVPGGRATGGLPGGADAIPFASAVEKPALALSGNPAPRYPEILRRAGIEGQVVIQAVVDTTGRLDSTTVKVVSSDHPLFEAAVRDAVPRLRFLAAETGGKKVKMWVIMPFNFEVKP